MSAATRLGRSLLVGLAILLFLSSGAIAGKKKKKSKAKKYHLELVETRANPEVDAALVADALRLLEAEVVKQFAAHPQLVADISKAPEPEANKRKFVKWLNKKKIAGAFKVDVDISLYREELEDSTTPNAGKDAKRLVVRIELHMFGETMPGHKMGFEGVGSATIKQDVGKKVRAADREYTIQSAVELAVTDAIKTSLEKLATKK